MRSLLTLAAALLLTLGAHADTLTLSFAEPAQSASSAGVLSFVGTVTAPVDNGSSVYLNGDAFTLDQPYFLDDTAFANAPSSLAAGDVYSGVLFEVPLTDPLVDGTFNGTFSLLGGADAGAQDILVTEPFSFTIFPGAATSVTPEPPSLLLSLSGAALLAAAASQRRNTRRTAYASKRVC